MCGVHGRAGCNRKYSVTVRECTLPIFMYVRVLLCRFASHSSTMTLNHHRRPPFGVLIALTSGLSAGSLPSEAFQSSFTSSCQNTESKPFGRRSSTSHVALPNVNQRILQSNVKPLMMAEGTKYGRGSEIWPPTNEEPVRLADSFPGGAIPKFAADLLAGDVPLDDDTTTVPATSADSAPRRGRKRRLIRGAVGRVLRRAATSEQRSASGDRSARGGEDAFWDAPVDRAPAVVALLLAVGGLVLPTDVMTVAGLTAYLVVLGLTSSSPREVEPPARSTSIAAEMDELPSGGIGGSGSLVPMVPSLPPQGHVPSLVSNPLGVPLTNSAAYRTWLRLGAIVGLILPLASVLGYGFGPKKDLVSAALAARPCFLLCCQAVTEATSRRLLAPLPLRIFIPVAYNAVRLAPLWSWALTTTPLGPAGRALAIANYAYWTINLFAFLLPIGAIRYMRAHFFCVEAAEVQLRKGQETSAGLLP